MNSASQWRIDLVKQIIPAYAAHEQVAAVILGGSTARGHADRYSDIELGVFWHQPPTDADRQSIANQIPGDLVRLYPYDAAEEGCCDDFLLGRRHPDEPNSGILLEVVHYTTNALNRTFDAVLDHADPDPLKQNLIAGIVQGLPLLHPALVQQWQARAATYPDRLATAVIKRYAVIDHFWRWEMWLARNNNLMQLYHAFAQVQQQLLHVLLGLNRVYYFGFKWIDVVAAQLRYKPDDLVYRFSHVYEVTPAEGARALTALVEETYSLIEQHRPEIDVDWLRNVFHYQRPIWDNTPPWSVATQ